MTAHKVYSDEAIRRAKELVAPAREHYTTTPRDEEVRMALTQLLVTREHNILSPKPNSKMGLLVTGQSGAGKSALLTRALSTHSMLPLDLTKRNHKPYCSFEVEPPANLKGLGLQTVRHLGYPKVEGRGSSRAHWDDVRTQIELRDTSVMHWDEAGDIFSAETPKEIQKVLRIFKNLMNSGTVLVLSGMVELERYLEADMQALRRFIKLPLQPISFMQGGQGVTNFLGEWTAKLKLKLVADEADLVRRIIHAADHQLGRTFEIAVDGIEEALMAGSSSLTAKHFAAAYERQARGGDSFNIFMTDRFEQLRTLHTSELRIQPNVETSSKAGKRREKSIWG